MKPSPNQALLSHGMKLHKAKKIAEAKSIYLKVLTQEPNNADLLQLLGILHNDSGEYDIALNYFLKVKALKPRIPQLYFNMALAYKRTEDYEQAITCYKKAVHLNPNYVEAYYKLAGLYNALKNWQGAVECYNKIIDLKSNHLDAWLELGAVMHTLKLHEEAKKCFENVLMLDPRHRTVHINLAGLYKDMNQIETAIACYHKALAINPDCATSQVNLIKIAEDACDWTHYQEQQQKLLELHRQHIAAGASSPVAAFAAVGYEWAPQDLLDLARSQAMAATKLLKPFRNKLNFNFERTAHKRLKIAYLSADFHEHPCAYVMKNLFGCHDRKHFEIFAFSQGKIKGVGYQQRIASTCDHFIDITLDSDIDLAKRIYSHNIDIVVDINAHTANTRMQMLYLRPAPISVHYLGFPGTTGADYVDYILVDDTVVTPEHAEYFSEKLVYLPNTYQVNDDTQPISDKPMTRRDYDLPEDAFVYCCFNTNYKIDPEVFSVWMEILTKTPKSVLWLFSGTDTVKNNFRREASASGVNPVRLVFAKREEAVTHLARQRLADLFLDTFKYNAHATGSMSLWAGLPILTCPGKNFANRVGASLLKAVGLPEMIMPNREAYRDAAIHFYTHPEQLQKIRQKLLAQNKTSALFDTKRFAANLEQAYMKMWEIFTSGQPPQNIYIKEPAK